MIKIKIKKSQHKVIISCKIDYVLDSAMNWNQVTSVKHILLTHCGWGNFRKCFRIGKPIDQLTLTLTEQQTFINMGLAPSVTELIKLMNMVIRHEIKLQNLITRYFGKAMVSLLKTGIYSKTVTDEYALGKWIMVATKVFPGYKQIDYGPKWSRGQVGDPFTVVMRHDGSGICHMTGILLYNDSVYYIDSNAEPVPRAVTDKIKYNVIRYPTHPVNIKMFGRGQCTMWTLFFAQILMSAGPMDYTKIPPDVFYDLFRNYCATMRSGI